MSYVAYHKETTRRIDKIFNGVHVSAYQTETAAKAAITRICNKQMGRDTNDYAIAEIDFFYKNIEKKETVRNLMSGSEVTQSVNTPLCCDPSSETYWSM